MTANFRWLSISSLLRAFWLLLLLCAYRVPRTIMPHESSGCVLGWCCKYPKKQKKRVIICTRFTISWQFASFVFSSYMFLHFWLFCAFLCMLKLFTFVKQLDYVKTLFVVARSIYWLNSDSWLAAGHRKDNLLDHDNHTSSSPYTTTYLPRQTHTWPCANTITPLFWQTSIATT